MCLAICRQKQGRTKMSCCTCVAGNGVMSDAEKNSPNPRLMHMVFTRVCQNSIDFEATFFRQNWVIKRVRNSILYWELQVILTWGAPIINIPGIPLRCWNIFFGIFFWECFGIFLARGIWYPPSDYTWNIIGLELPISLEYFWIYFFWLSDISAESCNTCTGILQGQGSLIWQRGFANCRMLRAWNLVCTTPPWC